VSSLGVCYRKIRDVRIREVPEMEFCLAYVPARAELYRLNPAAWFVLRMSVGRTERQIAAEYHDAMAEAMSMEECEQEVHAGLLKLMEMGIVEQMARAPRKKSVKRQPKENRDEHQK